MSCVIIDRAQSQPNITASLSTDSDERSSKNAAPVALPWIVRLRYGVIAGEIALIAAFSLGLRIALPLDILAAAIGLQVISNWLLQRRIESIQQNAEPVVGGLFCFDTLCLTLILAMTGGPTNPFSLLYLVQITFSAVVLHKLWTWTLGVLSTLSFGVLFWVSPSIPALQTHFESGEFSLHLLGMWVAFATAALLISFFVGKVSAEARRKDQELLLMQKRLARNERLASLVTLSAGAAHEIATPLSTIAVTAKEIEQQPGLEKIDPGLVEDAQLIRSQVERCRVILERMGAQGADPLGEAPTATQFLELLSQVRARFPDDVNRILIEVDEGQSSFCVLPRRAAVEALAALVKNALDASGQDEPVTLQARPTFGRIRFLIRDQGVGMTPEVLERVSEPFFTTKPTGKGMGLGAFLAHLFAQRLGGELSFDSQPGRGCTAVLELPVTHVQS
jgi:two-component system sensor histidine kinase RegB